MAAVKWDLSTRFAPRGEEGIATTKEPTVPWADISVSGSSCPKSDGVEMKVEADHQSIQMGYDDEHQAEDGGAMQEGNTHSTGVASEQSEERGVVGRSDVRNDAKAPCVESRRR
jgi:hypothetical protein